MPHLPSTPPRETPVTYLLLEGEFAENKKIQALSDKAFRLHVAALCLTARNLKDGAISEIDLRILGANVDLERPKRVVNALVTAGLWETNGHGWKIHDYLEHNPSRADILRKRALTRRRNLKWKAKKDASPDASQDALVDGLVTRQRPTASSRPTKVGSTATAGDTRAKRSPAVRDTRCEECGETVGRGHLEDCPVLIEARRKALA